MTLTSSTDTAGPVTILRDHVVDQAVLHGLLAPPLRDIGLPLISITRVETRYERRAGHRSRKVRPMSRAPATVRSPAQAAKVRPKAEWPVPVALIALSVIPLMARALRLLQLSGGPAVIPADDRFAGFPASLLVPIVGAALYAVVGVFPVRADLPTPPPHLASACRTCPGPRQPARRWVGAVDDVQFAQKPGTGDLLLALRLVFASAMAACLVLGISAVRTRGIPAHRAWMIRAYAIGLAAGTQVFTEPIGAVLLGTGDVPTTSPRAPAGS